MRMYPEIAVEKAMKRQEIILRAYAKKISWIEAAEILGYSPRHLRRLREKYEEVGFDGIMDGRLGRESPRRIPVATIEEVLGLYREKYFDFNVTHFVEKLREHHSIEVSYTWVKNLLQGAGLVARDRPRKKHRRRRERKPLRGMMLHIDGSHHRWFGDERWHDLIVILDDATGEIYYAQLVDAESTATVMTAIRQVVEREGVFCSLYSDRAGHFFRTPKAGEPVDGQSLTQVGRALRELSIKLIPSYSPQARGRSERSFRTWQGRLPQELRIRGITDVDEANRFLRRRYIREFNRMFTVQAAEPGASAFVPCTRTDLDRVFSIQTERTVNRDNTVQYRNVTLQIDRQSWRRSMDGCRVTVYQHLNGVITVGFGPQELGRYAADGRALNRSVSLRRDLKTKRPAAPPSNRQTGHLMC
jgi:transposase